MAASALVLAGGAHAQEASRAPEAEALFEQGRRLAAEGKWAEACPKLAASEQADPGAGTLLNLGNCYEQNHQTASAWATFREAASMAKQQGRADWEALARTRAAALEPKLSKLKVVVSKEGMVPGLVVKRDGVAMAEGAWGTPIPLDPQAHTVEASAPGRVTWSKTIALAPQANATIAVPTLAAQPVAASAASSTTHEEGSTQRVAGLVIAGVGVVGLAIGTVTGILAIGKEKDSRDKCPADPCATSDGYQANEDARTLARVSTIAFIAGGVVAAAGAAVYLTAPHGRASSPEAGRVRIAPLLDRRTAGLDLAFTW